MGVIKAQSCLVEFSGLRRVGGQTRQETMNIKAIATLRTGEQITGKLTTDHAASSYGQPVFVDEANQAFNWLDVADVTTIEPGKVAAALGSIKSERKARSSAENGKRGGRPRKKNDTP